ncbi:MAG: hypothetical protein M1820_003499 [Bogoriella megaspora]|nr:MAG: hypothetical protein M1820_003499 [Bogoriella megaspora]
MKDYEADATNVEGRGSSDPAIQGSGGGPSEENVTGILVRSTEANWSKGSLLAVDAGSHLAAITRILEQNPPAGLTSYRDDQTSQQNRTNDAALPSADDLSTSNAPLSTPIPSGPFAGLPLPHHTARANAGYIVREHVSTYLITHPHLDHLSGFAINTAAFHNTSRPKRLAALPGTVDAIKRHIFNDVIWPNLTDEDGGVGFVTFQRLAEGGNIALGAGEGRGYIEVCNGLAVKGLKVSHGHCMKNPTAGHTHRGSFSAPTLPSAIPGTHPTGTTDAMPGQHTLATAGMNGVGGTPSRQDDGRRSMSISAASHSGPPAASGEECVIDSTAFFIRTNGESGTEKEVLIFGDVEPDSISLHPRTLRVWSEAASKIAHGILKAVFIECSYDDTQDDAVLFGHLAPRHLVKELVTLAQMVRGCQAETDLGATATTASAYNAAAQIEHELTRKRKRVSGENGLPPHVEFESPVSTSGKRSRSHGRRGGSAATRPPARRKSSEVVTNSFEGQPTATSGDLSDGTLPPLTGFTVVVIHVKDTLRDGPLVGENILRQLREHEVRFAREGQPLGCEFVISSSGASYLF